MAPQISLCSITTQILILQNSNFNNQADRQANQCTFEGPFCKNSLTVIFERLLVCLSDCLFVKTRIPQNSIAVQSLTLFGKSTYYNPEHLWQFTTLASSQATKLFRKHQIYYNDNRSHPDSSFFCVPSARL